MSIFDDFFDFVEDAVDDVGDTLQDAWDAVKSNPIGAITSVVAMSYGIPPTWAGALGGAAGAAATGGNIVKAAVTGGAMGYMGSMAGAAAGSLGPIAAGAASGAAAGVTGAILTGQDVMTAMKAGLILGTAAGGVKQFMTPSEAISKIPLKDIAEANLSSDPIGALAKSQGWYDSTSAQTAAQNALSQAKNNGTLKNYYADQIPDEVLEAAVKTSNPLKSVTEQMGWDMSGAEVGGAQKALNNYTAGPTGPSLDLIDDAAQSIIDDAAGVWSNRVDQAMVSNDPIAALKKFGVNSDVAAKVIELRELQLNPPTPVTPSVPEFTNPTFTPDPQSSLPAWAQQVNELGGVDRMYSVTNSDGTLGVYDAMGGYTYDMTGNEVLSTAPIPGQGTNLAQAPTDVVSDVPYRVDVGGSPVYSDVPGSGLKGAIPQGYELAPSTNLSGASYDANINAYIRPVTPTPIVPIVVPPTVTPTPSVPTPVTTVSTSTRTTYDGSVYKDEQKSDGTVVTTLVSGPAGSGTGTGTGAVTTPTQPPLTPPTQTVIPPGSSYVAPVDVTTPGTTTGTGAGTGTGSTTETPIVPIVVPKDPNNPDGSYHYGTYTLGEGNKVNIPTGLNPGWMAPTPYYQTTSDNQAQYYWGSHPYQPGPEFNAPLYNNVPAAPNQPWGNNAPLTAATPQQIMQAMGRYATTPAVQYGAVRP